MCCYNMNGSNELKFELTIDSEAFISKFVADIDGQRFIGKTKEKEEAKQILVSQPEIKTNIDSKSKISLKITIEQYLQKKFNFNMFRIPSNETNAIFEFMIFEMKTVHNGGINP